jgi:hypothetical protein
MQLSRQLGDELWVIVNNDLQAEAKRGVKSFQDQDFRLEIVKAIKHVDRVFLATDEVDQKISICKTLVKLASLAKQEFGENVVVIFAKGGDRSLGNSPETPICQEHNIKIVDGLGVKTHNSSDFIKKAI